MFVCCGVFGLFKTLHHWCCFLVRLSFGRVCVQFDSFAVDGLDERLIRSALCDVTSHEHKRFFSHWDFESCHFKTMHYILTLSEREDTSVDMQMALLDGAIREQTLPPAVIVNIMLKAESHSFSLTSIPRVSSVTIATPAPYSEVACLQSFIVLCLELLCCAVSASCLLNLWVVWF